MSSRRSLSQIEADLDSSRDRMGGMLDALQHRLAPNDLFERSLDYLQTSGAQEFVLNLRDSVARNPVGVGIFGVGLAWLMIAGSDRANRFVGDNTPDGRQVRGLGNSATSGARSAAGSVRDGVSSAAGTGRDGLKSAADGTQRGASNLAGRARRGAEATGDAARRGTARVTEGANYMLREQPLVTAAIGLAIGAAFAASLPRTRQEDQAMGEYSDDVVDSARDFGEQKTEEARAVARSAAEAAGQAASDEADRQGLSSID